MEPSNIGIFHWFGYIQPAQERIELIKKAEYNYIMLWWEDENYPQYLNKKDIIKIVNYYDLKLDNIHLPYDDINMIWSDNNYERNKITSKIIGYLDECKSIDVDTVVLHSVDGYNHNFKYMNGYNSFEKIVSYAEDIDIKIALENTQMFQYTKFLIDEFDSVNIGFCYDSSHDFIKNESMGEILEIYKNRLMCVHLSDNDGLFDRHWIPGNGNVDWHKIIPIIKSSNCKSFSMEVYPYEKEKTLLPYDFLLKAKSSLNYILANS